MDNDGAASDQNQKELSIAHAASTMINASDIITSEAYQANLQRIQEVKEIVRRLEMNNEVAHKNFLIDQLQKRAKDGREAEDMLAQLRSQPVHPQAVRFNNNVQSDKPEVILPTTATLMEVPESHSSPAYSSVTSTSISNPPPTFNPPPTAQQARVPQHQRTSQLHFAHYDPNTFRYYAPPPQHNPVPHSMALVGQAAPGWYTKNQPPHVSVHNPSVQTGFQPVSQSRSGYPPQAIAFPTVDVGSGRIRTPPTHGGPSSGPYTSADREPNFPTQSTISRPPVPSFGRPMNFVFRARVPPPGVSMEPINAPGQSSNSDSQAKPAGSQPRPVSTVISKPVAISDNQRPHRLPQQPQTQFQQQLQLPQSSPQSQHHPQQSQVQLSSQQPSHLPQTHRHAPQLVVDHAPSTSVVQPQNQPSQVGAGKQAYLDQTTFIKLFQRAVQRGVLRLKSFWVQAKASGVTDEWFKAAIESLPQDVWQSVVAQANQLGFTVNAPTNTPQQPVMHPGPNVTLIGIPPPPTATPIVQMAPATRQTPKPSNSAAGGTSHSTPTRTYEGYVTQLQYYAERAANSVLSAQVASIPKSATGDIAPLQPAVATPRRDVPQAQVNVRTPKDANKSTLARDVLHALGKVVEKPLRETESEPADKINGDEGNQLPEVNASHPVYCPTSPKPLEVPLVNSSIDAISPSKPPAEQCIQDEPQHAVLPLQSIAKATLEEECSRAGPIMIDLTLEESDESIDGKIRELSLPMQNSASAPVSSPPISPMNTTNHTPLLENLTLEEQPVDTTGAGGNADMHMSSPPLSLVAEENVDSELLSPPPGTAGSALPSFEPMQSEPDERPLDGQLPLFLPSPPISPAPTEPPATDPETINDEDNDKVPLKESSVEVDKMEIDTKMAMPPRVRKRRNQQVYVLIPPTPLYVKKAKMKARDMVEDTELGIEGVGSQDEELQYTRLEQLLIEESKLRLLERRCQWMHCGAILNCATNLLLHVKNHAREEGSKTPLLCHWASCHRQFTVERERDIHLERHTLRPLPCPFSGCNKQFDQPVEVMQHEMQHDCKEPLLHKPTCQPIVPAIPARLGPPPQRLPAHRVIPRRVAKCQITADRHAIVGPWVLWNIFSPVDLNMRKQNASMRGRPDRQAINYEVDKLDARRDDYDFLLALSSYPPKDPHLDDLDSTLITMSAARGLTLWGSSTRRFAVAEQLEDTVGTTVPSSEVEETTDEERGEIMTSEEGHSKIVGEEDDVEKMLTL